MIELIVDAYIVPLLFGIVKEFSVYYVQNLVSLLYCVRFTAGFTLQLLLLFFFTTSFVALKCSIVILYVHVLPALNYSQIAIVFCLNQPIMQALKLLSFSFLLLKYVKSTLFHVNHRCFVVPLWYVSAHQISKVFQNSDLYFLLTIAPSLFTLCFLDASFLLV